MISCLLSNCKRDVGIVAENPSPTTPVSISEQDLIGSWTNCTSCGTDGPFVNLKMVFNDSGKVKIIDDYNSGTDTFGTVPFAYGTYKILGGDTLTMILIYDSTQTNYGINDTNKVRHKITKYTITEPYNIPFITYYLIDFSLYNDPLGTDCNYWSNDPIVGYYKRETCYGN